MVPPSRLQDMQFLLEVQTDSGRFRATSGRILFCTFDKENICIAPNCQLCSGGFHIERNELHQCLDDLSNFQQIFPWRGVTSFFVLAHSSKGVEICM